MPHVHSFLPVARLTQDQGRTPLATYFGLTPLKDEKMEMERFEGKSFSLIRTMQTFVLDCLLMIFILNKVQFLSCCFY